MSEATVPIGYKQTEVGVIPADWDVAPVGQAFEICNSLRMPISQAVREKMAGPFPYYGPTSIQGYINEYRIEGEYALIGEDGDHFLKWRNQPMTQLVCGRFNVNNHAHLIKGLKNVTAWFYYYFSRRDLTTYLTRQGAGRFKLTKSVLTEIPCAIPPTKTEQEAIAEALSDADALIESLEQLLVKKRQLKQGAMQELLTGKKRLPGFEVKAGVKQTEVGVIPEDWETAPIVVVAETSSGTTPSRAMADRYFLNGQIAWVKTLDLNNSEINSTDERVTGAALNETSLQVYPSGSVMVAMYGGFNQIGRTGLLRIPATVNQAITAIRPKTRRLCSEYLLMVLNFRIDYWKSIASSSRKDPNITSADIRNFPLALPNVAEQKAIAETLSDMGKEIAALEAKLAKAQHIKHGMMQELLTGRIRLI